MKLLFVALAVLGCLPSGFAHAEDCPIPKTQSDSKGFAPPVEDYPSVRECRDLTDRSKNGGKPLTLRQLEEVRAKYARDRNYSLEFAYTSVGAASMRKKTDCMIATGDIGLCSCLAEELPVVLSYLSYVHIVTNPAGSDFSYLKLNPQELRKLTGIAWSVRDMCIVGK